MRNIPFLGCDSVVDFLVEQLSKDVGKKLFAESSDDVGKRHEFRRPKACGGRMILEFPTDSCLHFVLRQIDRKGTDVFCVHKIMKS